MTAFSKVLKVKAAFCSVYRVNGPAIRGTKAGTDWIGGGHSLCGYRFIPEREVWIEDMGSTKEERYLLGHELVEIVLMAFKGWNYERAHQVATKAEYRLRRGVSASQVITSFLTEHGVNHRNLARDLTGILKAY